MLGWLWDTGSLWALCCGLSEIKYRNWWPTRCTLILSCNVQCFDAMYLNQRDCYEAFILGLALEWNCLTSPLGWSLIWSRYEAGSRPRVLTLCLGDSRKQLNMLDQVQEVSACEWCHLSWGPAVLWRHGLMHPSEWFVEMPFNMNTELPQEPNFWHIYYVLIAEIAAEIKVVKNRWVFMVKNEKDKTTRFEPSH